MNYYVWINHHEDGSSPLEEVSLDHRKYLQTHNQIIIGGSFLDKTGGMLLIIAESLKEARAIAEGDPMIEKGYLKYEMHEWKMQINNFINLVK